MPVPSVVWETARMAPGDQRPGRRGRRACACAIASRTGPSTASERALFVVVRPFQVTPPWQSFRNVGGVSRIHELDLGSGQCCGSTADARACGPTPARDSAPCASMRGSSSRGCRNGALPAAGCGARRVRFRDRRLRIRTSYCEPARVLSSGSCGARARGRHRLRVSPPSTGSRRMRADQWSGQRMGASKPSRRRSRRRRTSWSPAPVPPCSPDRDAIRAPGSATAR